MQLTVKAEFLAGTDITDACQESWEFANKNNCNVTFDFNGITLTVSPGHSYKHTVDLYFSIISQKGRL